MIRSAACLLALSLSASADYVVLTGFDDDDPYHEAARLLAAHHGTEHLIRFDPAKPDEVLPALRRIAPRHVAIVLRPEQIDVDSVRRILRMAAAVDDDPFVDFAFGYVTGATAQEAAAFVRNIVKASKEDRARKVGKASVWGGKHGCLATDGIYAAGAMRWPMRSLRFTAPDGKHGRDQDFIDAELASLEGCGAIIMGGHGMPGEIGTGPRAEDLAGLELFPAVAFNYACYTGVTGRYPERRYERGTFLHRMSHVEKKRSFALAMIRAGVTGYVAYVNPRPAGPEMSIEFQRVLAGATLGAARRRDYDKVCLGYLGFGERGIVAGDWPDGARVPAKDVDAVRHMMLDGATGGILYGDPAMRPYPGESELPLKVETKMRDGALAVTMRVDAGMAYVWCADPFRRFGKSMATKTCARVPLPDGWDTVTSVSVASATWGGADVETLEPVWAIETDRGRRYLHVKANFKREHRRGDIVVTVVARTDADSCARPRARGGRAPARARRRIGRGVRRRGGGRAVLLRHVRGNEGEALARGRDEAARRRRGEGRRPLHRPGGHRRRRSRGVADDGRWALSSCISTASGTGSSRRARPRSCAGARWTTARADGSGRRCTRRGRRSTRSSGATAVPASGCSSSRWRTRTRSRAASRRRIAPAVATGRAAASATGCPATRSCSSRPAASGRRARGRPT